ncbi:MAG: potassium channel family protein [Actinomycetes bacterium]
MTISRRHMASSAALYAPLAAAFIVLTSGVLVFNAESGVKGANIKTLPDALWWAATTITTVGYGDRYPVTAVGKAIAVALMLLGIALLSAERRDADEFSNARTSTYRWGVSCL